MSRREDRARAKAQRQAAATQRRAVTRGLAECIVGADGRTPLAVRRCQPSGKVVYPTQQAAISARGLLLRQTNQRPQHTYPCPRADHWHLTSDPQPETCTCKTCAALAAQRATTEMRTSRV